MDYRNVAYLKLKRTDPVERYREYVEFRLAFDGEGPGLREARQALADAGLTDHEKVIALDVLALACIQEEDYIAPELLGDISARPLTAWWWHLGKLRAGTYPADILPPHLRAIYPTA